MSEEAKDRIATALMATMEPLAKLLLAGGVNYRIFSLVSKIAFVQIATEAYGVRGRPTNVSRVAAMTGLTRKEVKRLRDSISSDPAELLEKTRSPADVLHRWHTDLRFLTKDGAPRELHFSEGDPSFLDLVKLSGTDVPPGAIRAELKRVRAVVELPNGALQVRQRHFLPSDLEDQIVEGLYYGIRTLTDTIAFNVAANRDNRKERRIQRVVEITSQSGDELKEIREFLEKRLSDFSEEIDDKLACLGNGTTKEDPDGLDKAVGVGLYYFEDR